MGKIEWESRWDSGEARYIDTGWLERQLAWLKMKLVLLGISETDATKLLYDAQYHPYFWTSDYEFKPTEALLPKKEVT